MHQQKDKTRFSKKQKYVHNGLPKRSSFRCFPMGISLNSIPCCSPWFPLPCWYGNSFKAESIPWEIDDLFVVDELTASSMPPQNSTRSIRSVASGYLGADDDVCWPTKRHPLLRWYRGIKEKLFSDFLELLDGRKNIQWNRNAASSF